MNHFNRLLAVVVLLGILACVLVTAVVPFGMLSLAQQGLTQLNETLSQRYLDDAQQFRLIQLLTVVVAAVVLFPLLWWEVRRRGPATVRVASGSGERATLTADSVTQRLAWHIDQLPDVVNVSPVVRAHGGAVDVRLTVRTTPDIDVPMKTDEIIAVTREVVEERMGLRLGKVQVQINHAPYADDTRLA
jgi:hypothetical protein